MKTAEEIEIWIGLAERFMPKQVNLESQKEMAMYELYHRMKQALAQFQPSPVDIEAEEIIADLQGTATALRVNGLKEAAKILDVSIDKLKQYFSREPSAVDTGAEDDLWEEVIELMEAFNDDPCFINPDVITAAKNNYTIARRAGQSKGIKQ